MTSRIFSAPQESTGDPLRDFSLFRKLDAATREHLATRCGRITVEPEQDLAREGDEMEALHLVVTGSLAIFRDAVGSPVVLLRRLYPGDYVGHVALYGNGRYWATVRASEKTTLLRLPKQDLLTFLADQPEIRAELEIDAAKRHSANLAIEMEVE
jgi:CRP-like cAMP-binding protein